MYLLVPMILYIGERILRILRAGYKKVSIQKVLYSPCCFIIGYAHTNYILS